MKHADLREFIAFLEQRGELRRITQPVNPVLEMTEICDRTLRRGGPALLFENVVGHSTPVLANSSKVGVFNTGSPRILA